MTEDTTGHLRVEIMVGDTKMLDAIVPDHVSADEIWHWWCTTRYNRGLHMGGASIHLAQYRMWDVKVGENASFERSEE